MRSFIEDEGQQRFLHFQLSVVIDQTQFPKFVQKKIHAGSCRPNQRSKCILIHLYRYRFQTKIATIIGQEEKGPCQPHLAGIEQLVDQVRLNPGCPSQKMVEKKVGKLLIMVEQAHYSFRLYPYDFACRHCDSCSQTQRRPSHRSFAAKLVRPPDCNDGFLSKLGNDRNLDLASMNVKN